MDSSSRQHTLPHSNEPDAWSPSELDKLHNKLTDLVQSPHAQSWTPLEKELTDIILRLTLHPPVVPDTTQLISQAQTIAELIGQREFLLQKYNQDRARWQAEREGWDRVAQILLTQRYTSEACNRDEVAERHILRLESENKVLNHRLSEARSRMSALESELYHLRPLLLMKPPEDGTSFTFPSLVAPPLHLTSRRRTKKDKGEDAEAKLSDVADVELLEAEELASTQASTSTLVDPSSEGSQSQQATSLSQSQFTPQSRQAQPLPASASVTLEPKHPYYRTAREREMDLANPIIPRQRKPKRNLAALRASTSANTAASPSPAPHNPPASPMHQLSTSSTNSQPTSSVPLSSDARAEFLLLAARTIGRQRAGVLAGFVRNKELEPTKKVARERSSREGKGKEREKTKDDIYFGGASIVQYPIPYQTLLPTITSAPQTPQAKTHSTIPTAPSSAPPFLVPLPAPIPSSSSTHPNAHSGPSPIPPPPPHLHLGSLYLRPGTVVQGQAGGMPMYVPMPWGAVPPVSAAVVAAPTTPTPVPSALPDSVGRGTTTPSAPSTGVVGIPMPAPRVKDTKGNTLARSRTRSQVSRGRRAKTQTQNAESPGHSHATSERSTALDSLLNAARTLEVDEEDREVTEEEDSPKRRVRRGVASTEVLRSSSSPAKRRKVDKQSRSAGGASPGRLRSGLDVLADQAIQEQRRSSVDSGTGVDIRQQSAEPQAVDKEKSSLPLPPPEE